MARQNEEEDQLKIEVEIFWPFFLARFPGQIQKTLQPKFEVEIYLALFCGWFPDKTLGCFQDNYPCLVDLLQTFSLLTQMQIQNPKSQHPFCTIKIHLSGFGAWKQRDGGCWNGPVTIIHLPEGFSN